jgi:hypothetical protein
LNSKIPSSVPQYNVLPSWLMASPAVLTPCLGSCVIRLDRLNPRLNSYVSVDGGLARTVRRRSRICVIWRRRRSSLRSSGAVELLALAVLVGLDVVVRALFARRAWVERASSMVRQASSVELMISFVTRRACAGIGLGERVGAEPVMLLCAWGMLIVPGSIDTTTEA